MPLKIATWNVNSLRVRLPQVLTWLEDAQPDILALQETKTPDETFPFAEINQAGYQVVFNGQKTYNGVAILSRVAGMEPVRDIPDLADPQRRVLTLTIGKVRIINLYIPNGEHITSEKFQYKLGWLNKLHIYLQQELAKYPHTIMLGDFNIAPHPKDVHDPAEWEGRILFTEPERTAFQKLLTLGFNDCFRLHEQEDNAFTWWDYRMNSFKRNRGVRIDHILSTAELAKNCLKCYIDKTPRGWERPSDHTPVIPEFVT